MIVSFMERLYGNLLVSFEESDQHLTNYAVAVLIGIFGFYIFNLWVNDATGYENFPLRLLAGILVFLLLIRKYWPTKSRTFLLIYWYITLIYTLPFFFTFMLLHNSSLSIWHVNGLIGLVVLALFVDWASYIFLLIVGVILGFLAYYLTQPANAFLFPSELTGVVLNYIAPIIYIMLFSKKRHHIQWVKQQSLKMQAGAIAHEMRTPLSTIHSIATALEKNLPVLLKNQRWAQKKDQTIPVISDNKLHYLDSVPGELSDITKSSLTVIDMLLMNLQEKIPDSRIEHIKISECITIALHDYALTKEKRGLISVDMTDDFTLKANPHLLKHVFFNLLKNALHYIHSVKGGKIVIWAEKGEKVNKLYFKDTGMGIPPKILPYIFDQFYSRTKYGTGLGLAFCKTVMENLGGDITCVSKEGIFTEFTLTFPCVTE